MKRLIGDIYFNVTEVIGRAAFRLCLLGCWLLRDFHHPLQDDPRLTLIRFGDDFTEDGFVVSCVCNLNRYDDGHMETCPVHDYPPEVIMIESKQRWEERAEREREFAAFFKLIEWEELGR